MTFVDTNVFVYAVGGPHPLRDSARDFLKKAMAETLVLVTSAEVLQELVHAYIRSERFETLDSALALALQSTAEVWDVTKQDVLLARDLVTTHRGLQSRDLLHLACCRRRDVSRIQTFDRALAAAFDS